MPSNCRANEMVSVGVNRFFLKFACSIGVVLFWAERLFRNGSVFSIWRAVCLREELYLFFWLSTLIQSRIVKFVKAIGFILKRLGAGFHSQIGFGG